MHSNRFKFRVWDKTKKKFATCINDHLRVSCDSIVTIPINAVNFVIQQYTGFKDCNGRDIYEGDIMRETVEKGPDLPIRYKYTVLKDYERQHTEVVKWGNYSDGEYVDTIECFMFGDRGSLSELIGRTKGKYHEWIYNYEVVGNIFENKELLK